MTDSPERIDADFKAAYHAAQEKHGKYSVPAEIETALSEDYKQRHTALILARKNEESAQKRTAEASPRYCRTCGQELPLPDGRGRPRTICESCRDSAAPS